MRLRKEEILRVLREALREEGGIAFAVVFGSFVRRDTFRDVDLGIYLDWETDELEAAVYAEELSARLTRRLGVRVDVVVLNFAPMWLKARALKEGVVVLDRDPVRRAALRLAVLDTVRLAGEGTGRK